MAVDSGTRLHLEQLEIATAGRGTVALTAELERVVSASGSVRGWWSWTVCTPLPACWS
jgi:hypothetical protein